MEECQILRSREAMQLRATAIAAMPFPDILLTGPSVMDVDTKIRERLYDFNSVLGHRHKGARGKEASVV